MRALAFLTYSVPPLSGDSGFREAQFVAAHGARIALKWHSASDDGIDEYAWLAIKTRFWGTVCPSELHF